MQYLYAARVRGSFTAFAVIITFCLFAIGCLSFVLPSPSASAQDPLSDPISRPPSVQAQIVGGEDATRGELPWQAHIVANGFLCGGALIDPGWILTAAHCLFDTRGRMFTPDQISVTLGEHNTNEPEGSEQEISVRSFTIHPDYNTNSNNNDLALLELNREATINAFVQLLQLVEPDESNLIAAGQLGTVSGWGATVQTGLNTPILQKVSVPLVSLKTCRDAYSADLVTANMICAGYPQGEKDACQGDSGSPLYVQSQSGPKQVGIVSWGIGCAQAGYYGVYTNVSQYTTWIRQTAGLVPQPTPTPTNTPTPTPTPTATNTPAPELTLTPVASPTPTPTTAPDDGNLLNNGNFDAGPNGAWSENSANFGSGNGALILTQGRLPVAVPPYSGQFAAWLGGADLESGNLTQSAFIAETPASLSYYYQIRALDSCGGDAFNISVNNTIVYDISLCQSTSTTEWLSNTIDLSDYSGQLVTLSFNVITDDSSPQVETGLAASNFFLDDVALLSGEDASQAIPEPEPTPTDPSTPPQIEAIENKDFEDTASDVWSEESTTYGNSDSLITPILALPQGIAPQSGSYLAWLGGATSETSRLSQRITVPSEAESLTFYYEVRSADACGFDTATVLINQINVVEFPLCLNQNTDGWEQQIVDVRPYAGQTVDLMFRLVSDNLLVSNWFIDNLEITTSARPLVSANPTSLTFLKEDAGSLPPQNITVTTSDDTVWNVATDSDGWLQASISGGRTSARGSDVIEVFVEPSNRTTGTYEGTISIRSQATLVTIPVSLDIQTEDASATAPDELQLTVQPGLSNMGLSWDVARSNRVSLYRVYRRDGLESTFIGATKVPRIKDSSPELIEGERYCYQVEGIDAQAFGGTATAPALAISDVACAVHQQLALWVPSAIVAPDDTVSVPVNFANADGLVFQEMDLWIDFDTSVISVTGVSNSPLYVDAVWDYEISEVNSTKSRIKINLGVSDTVTPPVTSPVTSTITSTIASAATINQGAPLTAIYGNGPLFYLDTQIVGDDDNRSAVEFRNFITGIGGSSIFYSTPNPQSVSAAAEAEQASLALTNGLITVDEFGQYRWGDVDANGSVSTEDMAIVLDFITGKLSPNQSQFDAAEVNGTGALEAADATRIFYKAVNGVWPPLGSLNDGMNSDGANSALSAELAGAQSQDVTIKLSDVEGRGGEFANILIEAAGLNNVAGADLVLVFDPDVISEIESVSLGAAFGGFQQSYSVVEPGKLAISLVGSSEADDVSVIALVKVKLARSSELVVSPLRLADTKLNDIFGRDLISSFASSSLTLNSATITLEPSLAPVNQELFLPLIVK